MGEGDSSPHRDHQREKVRQLLKSPIEIGQTWFAIDCTWLENFQKVLESGLDSDLSRLVPPIDNSGILDYATKEIKKGLIQDKDYVLVIDDLWFLLIKLCGVIPGQSPIAFKTVSNESGTLDYVRFDPMMHFKCRKGFDDHAEENIKKSQYDSVGDLEKSIREAFQVPDQVETRLWQCSNSGKRQLFSNKGANVGNLREDFPVVLESRHLHSKTWPTEMEEEKMDIFDSSDNLDSSKGFSDEMEDPDYDSYESAGMLPAKFILPNGRRVTTEVEELTPFKRSNDDGVRHFNGSLDCSDMSGPMMMDANTSADMSDFSSIAGNRSLLKENNLASSSRIATNGPSSSMCDAPGPSKVFAGSSRSSRNAPTTEGLIGLMNLGNTCFMNSVIQCMSHCPPITEYFLNNRHLQELNKSNPLGMKGEIAKAYGDLIQNMWSPSKTPYIVPSEFKAQVGSFNPVFSGCQQHDSQELLTFILDGLHEDLNKIYNKPYIEIKDYNGNNDAAVARESWVNYKKRNDSIIVDTFHGLLKSTVNCPDCDRHSITFDPFCYLSLPLPIKKDRPMKIRYIPYEGQTEMYYNVMVPKKGTIKDLCGEVAEQSGAKAECLLVAEVSNSLFQKVYCIYDNLESISEKDLFVYQLPLNPTVIDDNHMIVPLCFWENSDPESEELNRNQLFSTPVIIILEKEPITARSLYKALLSRMSRHFLVTSMEQKIETPLSGDTAGFNPLLKLYILDISSYGRPVSLEKCQNGTVDISESLSSLGVYNNQEQQLGRKVLLLRFSKEERSQFHYERLPDRTNYSPQRDRTKISIQDCLRLFTTSEKLSADDAWYCPACKKHQRATKKFDIWSLPQILIIHLKRFSYTRSRRDKIDTIVDFPLTDLDMRDYIINADGYMKYDLIGVCNHYGNMGGGHYTAICKNKINSGWYLFDDDHVSQSSPDNIVTAAAYVLFYMAKPTKLDAGENANMDIS